MADADAGLDAVVGAVADGLPVDWIAAEHSAQSPDDREFLVQLRHISNLAGLTRTLDENALADLQPPAPAIVLEADEAPRWGHFALFEKLGAGAQGEVFRALDLRLHREVALKLRYPSPLATPRQDAFLSEARLLARLRHHNVVTVYGADIVDGRAGLWMELIQGETLDARVRRLGQLSVEETITTGLALCAALKAVHGAGLLHGDLKAQNVLHEIGGRCVLMDFGVGRDVSIDHSARGRAGTPLYLAPEVLQGGPATVRSEVYSLGVLLYYLLTGKFPHFSSTFDGLTEAHNRRHAPLAALRPDVAPQLVAVVERALDPDRAQRFVSAEAFGAALEQASPQHARDVVPHRRPTALTWSALALAAAVTAGAVWMLATRSGPVVPANTVAILPFDDLSADRSSAAVAQGLTEMLTSGLGARTDLRVVARTTAEKFAGSRRNVDLAREAGVDRIVEGSVEPAAGTIKVSLRILQADSGITLWSKTFTGTLSALAALDDDMLRGIAEPLGKHPPVATDAKRWQGDAAAMEDYFRGWGEYFHLTREGFHEAERLFKSATSRSPSFAEAHAAYAYARLTDELSNRDVTYEEGVREARASAELAARLNPESALARATIGWTKFYVDWDWPGAEADLRSAVALNPSDAQVRWMYAQLLMAENRLDAALAEAKLVMRLDPLNPARHSNIASVLYYARDYEGSKQELLRSLERDPNAAYGRFNVSRMFSALGQHEEGLKWLLTSSHLNEPFVRAEQARQLLAAGHDQEARDIIRSLDVDYHAGRLAPDYLAFVRAAEGNTEAAFALLDEAVQRHSGTVIWIHVDPRYDTLRQDVRFVNILRSIGLAPALR